MGPSIRGSVSITEKLGLGACYVEYPALFVRKGGTNPFCGHLAPDIFSSFLQYGFTSAGYNFFICALGIEISLLLQGIIDMLFTEDDSNSGRNRFEL